MEIPCALPILHATSGSCGLLILIFSHARAMKAMRGDFGYRIQYLCSIRYLLCALCVLLWVAIGAAFGFAGFSVSWKWSYSAVFTSAYIFEGFIGLAALGRFPSYAILGSPHQRAVCSMRLLGMASLPFVTMLVSNGAELLVLAVYSCFVGLLFILVIAGNVFDVSGGALLAITKWASLAARTATVQSSSMSTNVRPQAVRREIPLCQEELASWHEDLTELRVRNMELRDELLSLRAEIAKQKLECEKPRPEHIAAQRVDFTQINYSRPTTPVRVALHTAKPASGARAMTYADKLDCDDQLQTRM
mmetsp:Transcript_44147/g.92188  ORF Transcript_44147/g.92188 Transcript_44147/m.92188 type:complete len:305 (+) Transcript_44147:161-1075(+)